jgi:hypothetical protein
MCAYQAWLVSEQRTSTFSGVVHSEHMAGRATASIYKNSSSGSQSMAENKVCPGTRTARCRLVEHGLQPAFVWTSGGELPDVDRI